jgi:hypothetical protein
LLPEQVSQVDLEYLRCPLDRFEKISRERMSTAGNNHPLALNDARSTFNVVLSLSDLLVQCHWATTSSGQETRFPFESGVELNRRPYCRNAQRRDDVGADFGIVARKHGRDASTVGKITDLPRNRVAPTLTMRELLAAETGRLMSV